MVYFEVEKVRKLVLVRWGRGAGEREIEFERLKIDEDGASLLVLKRPTTSVDFLKD